jgi:XTP/dITP diphosphohydrolase
MVKKILLGSTNRHKYEELREIFAAFSGELLFGGDFQSLSVEETGSSYQENALLKARAWSKATSLPAVADDSGLEVEALKGAPGIYSARQGENDGERLAWLLRMLEGQSHRKARFVACLAYCDVSRKEEFLAHGYCYGSITEAPRGDLGFGYDPLFIPSGYRDTLGVLGERVKSRISHRISATRALLSILREENVL